MTTDNTHTDTPSTSTPALLQTEITLERSGGRVSLLLTDRSSGRIIAHAGLSETDFITLLTQGQAPGRAYAAPEPHLLGLTREVRNIHIPVTPEIEQEYLWIDSPRRNAASLVPESYREQGYRLSMNVTALREAPKGKVKLTIERFVQHPPGSKTPGRGQKDTSEAPF